jgi:hypothetical protein
MMRIGNALCLGLVLWLTGCGDDGVLAEQDAKYLQIMVDLAMADRDTTRNVRNREARKRKEAAEKARVKFFQSRKTKAAIAEAEGAEAGSLAAIKAAAYKRHSLMASSWTPDEKTQETRLLGRLDELNSVQATWTSPGGKEFELARHWRDLDEPASSLPEPARAALVKEWQGHQMQVVGADLQALVQLRNKVAKRAGYNNYWELALAGQGLKPADVESITREMTDVVAPLARQLTTRLNQAAEAAGVPNDMSHRTALRKAIGTSTARSEADHYFDTDLAEERVKTALQDMGISTKGWQVYTGPSRYTRPGVYGFPVRPPAAVAIVISQDRRWTVWQYEALAHEGGHAVWWQAIGPKTAASPVLWEPPAPWFEGFAQFFERMVYEPGFHRRYVPELPADKRAPLAAWRARQAAGDLVNHIVRTKVERRLYQDPNSLEAITSFAAQTRHTVAGTPVEGPLDNGLTYDNALLSSILWTYPAYSQNFLFSALTEAWMWEAVTAQIGDPIGNAKVGPLLREKLVRAELGTPFPERLSALLPGDRSAPLKRYLEAAVLPPAPAPATEE